MKKIFLAVTLFLSFIALSSNANAQMPMAWGIGGLFQTDDANFLLGYTAIETNQPVFQVYDCEVDAFVFANGNPLAPPIFSVGLNFAEIPFSAPAQFNTLYEMVFRFFLLPVDLCGGGSFVDYFGFSTGWGGDYVSPFTWEGRFPIVCVALPAVFLGQFLSSGFIAPTVQIDLVMPEKLTYNSGDTLKVITRVSASRGTPLDSNVVLNIAKFQPSSPIDFGSFSPADYCMTTCKIGSGNDTSQTRDFPVTFKLITTGATFPLTFKVRVTIDMPPATAGYMVLDPKTVDSEMITVPN
jgi:hypothetical protein